MKHLAQFILNQKMIVMPKETWMEQITDVIMKPLYAMTKNLICMNTVHWSPCLSRTVLTIVLEIGGKEIRKVKWNWRQSRRVVSVKIGRLSLAPLMSITSGQSNIQSNGWGWAIKYFFWSSEFIHGGGRGYETSKVVWFSENVHIAKFFHRKVL